jgi:hypothetical protein
MNEAKYPSKERIERDGVLVHAEGDDLINDLEEAKRQGYDVDADGPATVRVTERVEKDGVLVAAEGDELPADQAKDLGIKSAAVEKTSGADTKPAKPARKSSK